MTATGVSGVTDGGANISANLDEVFTMEQCLYAIMLVSANDIALQVAEHLAGSVEGFVQMMNQRAAELGCTNTVFTNPTGLSERTSTPLLMTWLLLCRPPWKMKLSVPLQEPFPILSLLPTYQEASGTDK